LLNTENDCELKIYSKGNIYLNPSINMLYVHGDNINLNMAETRLIKYMLENDDYCTLRDLSFSLENSIKEKTIVMILSRLRKKIRYTTGYTVIKNRYKRGYYIGN